MENICLKCYATGLWGGQAFTNSKCKICGKVIVNGSTNVDNYCMECAKENNICRKCGRKLDE